MDDDLIMVKVNYISKIRSSLYFEVKAPLKMFLLQEFILGLENREGGRTLTYFIEKLNLKLFEMLYFDILKFNEYSLQTTINL